MSMGHLAMRCDGFYHLLSTISSSIKSNKVMDDRTVMVDCECLHKKQNVKIYVYNIHIYIVGKRAKDMNERAN